MFQYYQDRKTKSSEIKISDKTFEIVTYPLPTGLDHNVRWLERF